MEITYILPFITSIACAILVTLSWRVLNWVWFNPKRLERILMAQGYNGNSYRFLYGDTRDKGRMVKEARSKPMAGVSNDHMARTVPFYVQTVKNYGKKSFTWNGPVPVVNLAEPELMREVFMKIHEFQKPQTNPILNVVATGLVQLEGDVWAQHRKLLSPAFHIEKLKFMYPAFVASTNDMTSKWEEMVLDTGSCEVDVWSEFHKWSADVISRAAFGSSYEEGRRIFELITEQLVVAIPVINSVYIPGWRYIPTKANRRIMAIDKEIKTLLKVIIDKRQEARREGEKPKDDLLGILLESIRGDIVNGNENKNKKKKIDMSLEEVIDECKIFYLAGQGTTSTLLVWAIIMLSKHQEWQKRARQEVLTTFGNSTPTFQGLNHLKLVNMILQETLRLYPPVLELSRTVCQDIKVGDIALPKGVLVHLPIVDINHDENLWGSDAKEFNPDRFEEGISKATRGNIAFFSFGWGPRICIGSNFAMTEARMALALILQRFSFELSPAYAHAPAPISTLQPQHGAPIVLTRL